MPARRLSESFVHAVATPFRTASEVETTSYFGLPQTLEPLSLEPEVVVPEQIQTIREEIDCVAEEPEDQEPVHHCVKKVPKAKRVATKLHKLLPLRQRPRAMTIPYL